jgi:hypothetical protein
MIIQRGRKVVFARYFTMLLRRLNTVLTIFRIGLMSPLAWLFLVDLNTMATLYIFGIALCIGLIWVVIENYLTPQLPELNNALNIKLTESTYRKILALKSSPSADYDHNAFYAGVLDPILFFTVMWSLLGAYLQSTGYVYAANPHLLTLLLLGSCVSAAIYAVVNYREYQALDHQANELIESILHKVSESRLLVYPDQDKTPRLKWPYRFLGVGLFIGTYIFIQWLMPFHAVLGAPYPLGILVAGIIGYAGCCLRQNHFFDIILRVRPFFLAGIGFATMQIMIENTVTLFTGWSLQMQYLSHPGFILFATAISVCFGGILFLYEFLNIKQNKYFQLRSYCNFAEKDAEKDLLPLSAVRLAECVGQSLPPKQKGTSEQLEPDNLSNQP